MPNKPIELGFKFHCLANHVYIWDFHPTSNQTGLDPVPTIEEVISTGEIVMFLANKFPKRRIWNIYLDNSYTSLPLLLELLRKRLGIRACGMVRPNSKDFPEKLTILKNAVGQLQYHFKSGIIVRDVGILLWFDNAPITIMTTIHNLKVEKSEIIRQCKRPNRKSTNAKRALAEFGEDYQKELQIMVAINDYNFHMGGVETTDQNRSYYDTQLTTFRTWFPILFWAIDTILINSYI
ncbi:hypothetical protein L873DRAFT_1579108, partial [Choiromyces venosus 120613-1]